MKVRDLMTTNVASVRPDSNVTEVAKLMEKFDIGSVPVCERNGVVGIITDRDIVLRNIAKGKDPGMTMVRDVMTDEVMTASPDMDVEDVTDIMSEQQIRRLPVVENNKLVGIIALADIAIEDEYDFEASEALSEISEDE
jgi:CBS domain-containing protein